MQVTTVTTVQNSIRDIKTELMRRTVTRRAKMSDRSVIDQLTACANDHDVRMLPSRVEVTAADELGVSRRAWACTAEGSASLAVHRIKDVGHPTYGCYG